MTEQMLGLLMLPYIMPDYPLHKASELLRVDYTVPVKRIETRKFAPGVSPAELSEASFWHSKKVTPLHKRRSHNAQFHVSSGRTRGAKHASYTHGTVPPDAYIQAQQDIYKIPENPAENPENHADSSKLLGLPGMPPKKRQLADFVNVLTDDYLDDSEKLDMLEYRAKRPVKSVYTDSYSPVKQVIPWQRQEGG